MIYAYMQHGIKYFMNHNDNLLSRSQNPDKKSEEISWPEGKSTEKVFMLKTGGVLDVSRVCFPVITVDVISFSFFNYQVFLSQTTGGIF